MNSRCPSYSRVGEEERSAQRFQLLAIIDEKDPERLESMAESLQHRWPNLAAKARERAEQRRRELAPTLHWQKKKIGLARLATVGTSVEAEELLEEFMAGGWPDAVEKAEARVAELKRHEQRRREEAAKIGRARRVRMAKRVLPILLVAGGALAAAAGVVEWTDSPPVSLAGTQEASASPHDTKSPLRTRSGPGDAPVPEERRPGETVANRSSWSGTVAHYSRRIQWVRRALREATTMAARLRRVERRSVLPSPGAVVPNRLPERVVESGLLDGVLDPFARSAGWARVGWGRMVEGLGKVSEGSAQRGDQRGDAGTKGIRARPAPAGDHETRSVGRAKRRLREGIDAFRAGDLDAAEECFVAARGARATRHRADQWLARVASAREKRERFRIDEALATQAASAQARELLVKGIRRHNGGRYDSAIGYFVKARRHMNDQHLIDALVEKTVAARADHP